MACSDACHGELVRRLIAEFGEFKKVVDQTTGTAYRVPTRDIIEKGVKWRDLDRYPRWETGASNWEATGNGRRARSSEVTEKERRARLVKVTD